MSDIEAAVESLVEDTVNDAVSNSLMDRDFIDRDDAQSIAYDAAQEYFNDNISEHTSEGEGLSLYDANGMLEQVAEGRDCSDGESFRNAVLAIINANKLNSGASVDDGTEMTIKASGTDREIQAILTRRKEYFDSSVHAMRRLLGASPNGSPPPDMTNDDAVKEWTEEMLDASTIRRRNYNAQEINESETWTMPVSEWNDRKEEYDFLWAVAIENATLLGLLSGLGHGLNGEQALRVARKWGNIAETVRMTRREPLPETTESTETTEDVPH